jgi:hypothetical protein
MFGEPASLWATPVTQRIRYVIHADLPKSFEGRSSLLGVVILKRSLPGYYQETGRAGRDGQVSRHVFTHLKCVSQYILCPSRPNAYCSIVSVFLPCPTLHTVYLNLYPAREDAVKVQKLVRMSGNKNAEGNMDRTGMPKDFGLHAEQSLGAVRR